MGASAVHAFYMEECNPIIKVQKIIECESPEKKCEIEFKVHCDAYPDWMNCKIKSGSTFSAHVKSFDKKPNPGSSWLFKYARFCKQTEMNCNADLWAAVNKGECPDKNKKTKSNQ